jgi:hypothetical protein
MAGLDKRISKVEDALEKHLIESGEIRGDLKWLKKAVYFIMSSPIIIELLHHVHTAPGK